VTLPVGRARTNACARANALANALTLARELASNLDNAGGLDNAEVLVGTLARANTLALALANAGALNIDHTLDLNNALNHSHALAHALACDLPGVRGSLPHAHAGDLAHALIRDLVDLDPAAHWARTVVAGDARSVPRRVPRGLVALAVRLLPVAQRPRYRAEFRVELVELPRRERLGYSLRVLAHAWELRRALVEAVRTPDGAVARRAVER
jgi:hypothetical protein